MLMEQNWEIMIAFFLGMFGGAFVIWGLNISKKI